MFRATLYVLLLLGVFAAGAAWYTQHWFNTGQSAKIFERQINPEPRLNLEIGRGVGIQSVANRLAAEGYLAHPRLWQLMARLRGEDRRLQAGEYVLRSTQTPAETLTQFVRGDVRMRSLVIVEGVTVAALLQQIASAPKLKPTLTNPDAESLLAELGLGPGHAEGRFFPDTYRYRAGETDRDILHQAYARMAEQLTAAWSGRASGLPYENDEQLLIMASIIEKETGAEADRAQISQVFVRRLQLGMRLQTDPTVIYGLGAEFDGDLRSVDLVSDTPYNSYTRHGLPPTPISLPGAASLQAAAHPAPGEYLYFVSRGDGSSQFSKTLAEHNAAVRRFQLRNR